MIIITVLLIPILLQQLLQIHKMIVEFKSIIGLKMIFFDFIGYGGWYEINQDSQGLTLTIQHPLMGYATFTDYPLSVSENNRIEFKIYPNPVSEALFITSEKALINKIAVYQLLVKKFWKQSLWMILLIFFHFNKECIFWKSFLKQEEAFRNS